MEKNNREIILFEIPVVNMQRAKQFYAAVFGVVYDKKTIDNPEREAFLYLKKDIAFWGALVKDGIRTPSQNGVLIYFITDNVKETLNLAVANGAVLLNWISLTEKQTYIAKIEDTEGNKIALYQNAGLFNKNRHSLNEYISDWHISLA